MKYFVCIFISIITIICFVNPSAYAAGLTGSTLPITSIVGQGITTDSVLFDSNIETGISVDKGQYVINRKGKDQLIGIAVHVTATEKCSVSIKCDDVMAREIAIQTGSEWYYLRIPFSNASRIVINWSGSGMKWNEVKLFGRTPLSSSTNPEPSSIKATLGKDTSASADVMGFMCNWFEHGITDGMTKPGTREEFIRRFKECHANSLRFPGGTMTYGYPSTKAAVAAFKNVSQDPFYYGLTACYGLNNAAFGWASAEDYFKFCKSAGLTAWYEINPGYWYDSKTDKVYKTIAMDSTFYGRTPDNYSGNYVDQAVESAMDLARLAKRIGVNVTWEIGNEDYCYYTPATYAKLCSAFIGGIRKVNTDAKFAVCGDGYDWSDERWGNAFPVELYRIGLTRIDYSSEHLYMAGVGDWIDGSWYPRASDTAQHIGDAITKGWGTMRSKFMNGPKRFQSAGVNVSKVAITEWNFYAGSAPEKIEHSAGRALGDAEALCEMMKDGVSVFQHDLVRNSAAEMWFCRLDYYPDNPVGSRYHWFPEGAADTIVLAHREGRIIYNSDGVCISNHKGFAYVTAVNRTPIPKVFDIHFQDIQFNKSKIERNIFQSASLDCWAFDYYLTKRLIPASKSRNELKIESPAFSVVGYKVRTK